jgi:hypothetical protein
VEAMPYYEYEYIVKNLIDILKEKQEAEEGGSSMDKSTMMQDVKKYIPAGINTSNPGANLKTPKMPSYSTPNFPSVPSSLKI